MKKMILVMVMLSMALVFAACDGDNDTATVANNDETPVAAVEQEEEVVDYDEDDGYEEEVIDYDENDEDEDIIEYDENDEDEEEVTAHGFTRGTWDGDTFTSNQLGISFTKPDGWLVATDEEMAGIMGLGMEMMDLEFTPEMLELAGLTTIHDMVVSNPETGAMVQIMAERLVFPNTRISVEDYIDIVAEMLLSMDWTVDTDFPNTRLGTYTWYVYGSAAEVIPGFSIYGRYFVDIRDGFALTIQIVYSEASESVEEIIAMFS